MSTSHAETAASQPGTDTAKAKRARRKTADPKAKLAPFAALQSQSARVKDAKARLDRETTKLTVMVAETVSDKPGAKTWYAESGQLTHAETMEAIGVVHANALHRIMDRYRKWLTGRPLREQRAKGMGVR